jgi:hypothetical protein
VVDETQRGVHVELHGDEGELDTWTSPPGRRWSMAGGGALRMGGGQMALAVL